MRSFLSLLLTLCAAGDAPSIRPEAPSPAGGRVPTGQQVRPAGETLAMAGRPVGLALPRGGTGGAATVLYVKSNRGITVIDRANWRVRQELAFDGGDGGSMHGLALRTGAQRLYVTTAQQALREATIQPDGTLVWRRRILLRGPKGAGSSHPCGIAISADGARAWVCLSRNNTLAEVDLARGTLVREIPVGIAPYDVALMPGGRRAWVSNWGGRRPGQRDRAVASSGTPVIVDRRGIGASGTLSLVDLGARRVLSTVTVGLHPGVLELSRDGRQLYVANANSDTVSIVETARRRVRATISTRPRADLPFGSAPNALALSPDERTLFVANGGNNAVAVVSLRPTPRVRGFIPAGWYPGALAVEGEKGGHGGGVKGGHGEGEMGGHGEGEMGGHGGPPLLYVANVKGDGGQVRQPGREGWNVHGYRGTVSRVKLPDAAALRAYTTRVHADAGVPQILQARARAGRGGVRRPVPRRRGEPSVFDHVVYIIKENRTYDQILGDLPRGNGDPRLCIYPRRVTPNHHALAEQFVLLDNFYCNGVNSADGHAWATEGNVADYLERSFGGFTRSYTWGDDPLSYSSSGFLWDNVLGHGLSFRNYGEMDYAEPVEKQASWTRIFRDYASGARRMRFTQNVGIETLRRYTARDYPGWNMRIPDVLRASVFLRELRAAEAPLSASGRGGGEAWPNLTILFLPSDHTSGTQPGAPTPRAQVADNDLALGRVVAGITRSRFWPRTCIFVIEDDPQDGFDHVDGHRSPCFVISPYTRRGARVSRFYNQTAVIHTMERILGVPPMNQMDAMAPLMSDCFTERPDFRPYTSLPNAVPLDEMNPPLKGGQGRPPLQGRALYWALKSVALPLHRVDACDEDTLNRILWHAAKGTDAPYPAHMAGAHGRGLKGLGLVHTGQGDDH